ncbi:hypothetical protein [Streptomyces sp. NBC_00059]|uniref:hypothetical protein n=1 Tax=Streptomyces sp. NBC_00059 TaxID=2975635 RepID=UPI00224EEE10|nr:hypothetical protein [Streptomyces sp. NBC_00059]MCX5417331.1 hypothetical protein [Streptomyces sp. NBC_00059]
MLMMQPVLEGRSANGFALWPVAELDPAGWQGLSGGLTAAEVAAAVMRIAACNDLDPDGDGRPPRPADPLDSFLHGLLTFEDLFVAGGLRVVDTVTGVEFLPGCCSGLEEWRAWVGVVDGSGSPYFGHDPDPLAERVGGVVRLVVDAERSDSEVIELSVAEFRRLLDGAERDLTDFLALATSWVSENLPTRSAQVNAALARALDL